MSVQCGTFPHKGLCKCSDKCLDIDDKPRKCKRLNPENSELFLEDVLDMAHMLSKVMIICGIQRCAAKRSVDIVVNALLNCDQVYKNSDPFVKKLIRKNELHHDLGEKCQMNRVEAYLAYTIIKRGFKAFHYHGKEELSQKPCAKPRIPDENIYMDAAKKTAKILARFEGLTGQEQLCAENKIIRAYQEYYNGMEERMIVVAENGGSKCCLCGKGMELLAKTAPHPCRKRRTQTKPPKGKITKCCSPKERKVKKPKPKLPKYLDPFDSCNCTGIWKRPAMRKHRKTIEDAPKPPSIIEPCKDEPDPLKPMAGYHQTAKADSWDWFDAKYLKLWKKAGRGDEKSLNDVKARKEWPQPIWLPVMSGRISPIKEGDCDDCLDPP